MTIIDFATAAPKSPRPFPNPLVHAAARLVLADAPTTDAPVLDPHRLLLAASQLPPHAMFLIDLVADPADRRLCRFELALAQPGGDDTTALKRAALLLAPMARFGPTPSIDEAPLTWSTLAPAPLVLDAGVDTDGVPRAIWLSPSDTAAADFACALQCAEAAGIARLRIVVRARVLLEAERAAVNHHVCSHHHPESPAALERQLVLSQWSDSQRGAVIGVEVGARTPPDEGALDYIAMALFGRARQSGARGAHGLVVDLRCAATPGALPAFRFLPTPGELRRRWRPAEEDMSMQSGSVVIGLDAASNPIAIGDVDRTKHFFLVGATGSGKTTLIHNMIRQDIASGAGVVLIDPHGDLAEAVRREAMRAGRSDVTVVDPSDPACPIKLDIMTTPGIDPELERSFVVNQLITLFSKQIYADVRDAFGPVFESYFRNTCYLLMSAKQSEDRNLLLMQKVFADEDFRHRLVDECEDAHVREFFTMTGRVTHDCSFENVAPYITAKLSPFADNPRLRRFFDPAQGERLSLQRTMDSGAITVIRLPKGLISENDTRTLGALLLIQLCSALMGRARQEEAERRAVRIYIDEFQNFATRNAAEILAEIRKWNGSLILANQSLSQLGGDAGSTSVASAVLANCGSFAVFRTGVQDAALLAPYLAPHVTTDELLNLAVGDFIARRLVQGVPQPAQHLRGQPPAR